MIFERRYEKQMKRLQELNAERNVHDVKDDSLGNLVEKGDVLAMILSALIVILPVCLLVLLIVSAAGYFFVLH